MTANHPIKGKLTERPCLGAGFTGKSTPETRDTVLNAFFFFARNALSKVFSVVEKQIGTVFYTEQKKVTRFTLADLAWPRLLNAISTKMAFFLEKKTFS